MAATCIRAELIRFLMLGGDDLHPIHETGVTVIGGWISGQLDLRQARCDRYLNLRYCNFERSPVLASSRLAGLTLAGCSTPGLSADGMVVAGDVFLSAGFSARGEVRLLGAQIGGSLGCGGGQFSNADPAGTPIGDALSADRMVVTGSVFLNRGFSARGAVRLLGAQIGGNLDCGGGRFDNVDPAGTPIGKALSADRMVVTGSTFFRDATVKGPIGLANAVVGGLVDRGFVWPAGLYLDGFRYARIAGGATDAPTRISWLKQQRSSFLKAEDFRPQPWEQLINVLREMGHSAAAAEVAIAKQQAMRRAGQIGTREPNPALTGWRLKVDAIWVSAGNWASRRWHRAYGVLAGYGYRPADILVWAAGVWLAAALCFGIAAWGGIMAPTSAVVVAKQQLRAELGIAAAKSSACGIRGEASSERYWPQCAALPSEYTTFNPVVYSLDLILPLVDLGQEEAWAPAATYTDATGSVRWLEWGMAIRLLMWLEILFGWFASLMFVAIVSRLVEKD